MYDAVIFASAEPAATARTLATLVEGVVEGMLGRVVVVASADDGDLAKLTDAAGCMLLVVNAPDEIAASLKSRLATDHVLAFKAGALLPPNWPPLLRAEIRKHGHPHASGGLAFRPPAARQSLTMAVSLTIRQKMTLTHGGLIPRGWLLEQGFAGDRLRTPGPVRMASITVDTTPY